MGDYINGAADNYLALRFDQLYIAEYIKGKITVKAEVYCHISPVMAFGIYALERSPSYNFISIGAQGYQGEDHLHFFKGSYYVKVTTHSRSGKAATALKDIALGIDAALDGTTNMPGAISLFPVEGLLPNQEMFIAESVLGHQFLRRAFMANYSVNDKSFSVYIFNTGSEETNHEMLAKYLAKQGLEPGDSADGKFFFKDGYNGDVFLGWRSDLTVLVTGLKEEDAALAGSYINQILK
ncbi:MAG: DUF6599 family protein [Bacteroidales bacterium]